MTYWKTFFVVMVAGLAPLFLALLANAPLMSGLAVGLGAAFLTGFALRTSRPQSLRPVLQQDVSTPRVSIPSQDVLEILHDPLIVIGAQERVEFANSAARAIYPGYESGILLSTLVRHPEVLTITQRARQKGSQQEIRFSVRRPKARFFRVFVIPLNMVRMVLIFRDETELHHAENLRAGFLANVSHELRTPLASLSGYIDTLRGHAKDDTRAQEKFLAIMSDQAARMGRLIDDLLSLSRIEMDEHLSPKSTVDLGAVLGDVCDALTPVARVRNVTLELKGPDKPVFVQGDRDQLIQIAQNLIDNAIKYTPDGQSVAIRITDGIRRQSAQFDHKALGEAVPFSHIVEAVHNPEQEFATLEVRDFGPGMDPEHLPRLGDRFYRVEEGKSAERTGTGLGLAIVKHIVNRHRGSLRVQSQPGVGTVFTVAFPRQKVD